MASMQDLLNWMPQQYADAAANDSDKTFVVADREVWQVQSIYADVTSTADVGNRQMAVQFLDDAGGVVAEVRAGTTQAASLQRFYVFGLGVSDMTAFRDTNLLTVNLPYLILPSGYSIRVYDKAAIAATADDVTVRMMVLRRAV